MKGPATPSSPAHRRVEIDALRDAGHVHCGGPGGRRVRKRITDGMRVKHATCRRTRR